MQPVLAQCRGEGLAKLSWAVRSCTGQTSWHGKDLLSPRLLAADAPCASLGKAPRSCGCSGTCWQGGGLAVCLAPAWSTQPRSLTLWHLARGSCNAQGARKVSAWSRTFQPLPCRGLWTHGTKPGLNWGQPGRVGVSACESLHPAPMKMLFYSYRKGLSTAEI